MMKHNFKEFNSNSKSTVLLLHGWGGSLQSLEALSQELSIQIPYRIVNLELPGFGKTDLTKSEMSPEDYAEFVAEFIIENNLKNVTIIGHSFGGKVALNLTLSNPDLVDKLILINSSGIKPHNSIKKTFFKVLLLIIPSRIKKSELMRRIFYKKIVREQDYLNAGALKPTLTNIIQQHLDDKLVEINKPTLIIWSQNDSYVPLWMGNFINSKIKNSQLKVVPNATHGLPLQDPVLTAELISEFLTEN